MNIKTKPSRHGVAVGLASILVAGGTLVLPSAAVAGQACGANGSTSTSTYNPAVFDIDDRVALRKRAMYLAWGCGR